MSTTPTLVDDEPLNEQNDADQTDQTVDEQDAEPGDPLEGREDLQKCLYDLYVACCEEDRYPRLVEVMDAQQAHMYWRGLQYIWWSQRDECWNLPNQNQGLQIIPGDVDDMPRFEFVTNIYQAFGLSLIAAIGQAPPRTRWFPEDAEKPEDVETAEGYSKLSKIIERWNPIQPQMQDEIFHLWTSGTVAAWTRYIADKKYGTETIEDVDAEEQPEGGAVPVSKGTEDLPKGREIVTTIGALNLKRPIYTKSQSEFHYLAYEEELHYCKLRMAYPDIADKIKPGQGIGEDNGFERNARMTVMQGTDLTQQTGEAQAVLTTFARVWFRPEAFYHDKVKKDFRTQLLELFPDGCKVFFAGPTYCESESECMDDCWTVTHAMPGDGQHRNGLGTSMISVQDRFNTWSNIQAETYEYGLPITYRAGNTYDNSAESEQRSEPGSEVEIILDKGEDIRSRIMQVRNDSVSPDMLKGMSDLMGPVAQFLTGAFPALLGAGAAQGAAGDTASGYKMQMDQALGRCGVSYVRLKQFHADIQTLACKDYCKHATGRVTMPILGKGGDFENEAIDIDALEGDARAYPEGDENFPELWNVQRATFMQIMDTPQGQQLLTEPDNAELAVKLIGIPNLVLPGADSRRQAMRIIGMLTEPQETVQPDGSTTNMAAVANPEQLAGLIDPDDDPAAMYATMNHWRLSDAGMKCQKENPTGYANVRALMALEKAKIPPPPPAVKPLSVTSTIAVDKMPPEAQAIILKKEYGVDLTPKDFLDQALLEKEKKSKAPTLPTPGQPITGNQAQPGAGVANG
jgi:hypothetical protein